MSTTPQPRSRTPSRTRLPSRPTTPLRPPSRSSLRASQSALLDSLGPGTSDGTTTTTTNNSITPGTGTGSGAPPLDALEPAFAEMADALADLEANMLHLQLMHESVARFTEDFAAFLYGLNVNAFCVDFGEAPVRESWTRAERMLFDEGRGGVGTGAGDADATFLTTDTSFVENPPLSTKSSSKYSTPGRPRGGPSSRGRTNTNTGRGGGIPRASGIARGLSSTRGRGTGRTR